MALVQVIMVGIFGFRLLLLLQYPLATCLIPYSAVEIDATGAQNVTPCFSVKAYNIHIVNESLTWMDAEYSCKQMGYTGLMSISWNWRQWLHVKHVLQYAGFHVNMSYWEGHFRPYFHVEDWYRVTGNGCEKSKISITDDGDQFNQCASVHWETYSQAQRHAGIARHCTDRLPYICYYNQDMAYFHLYISFVIGQNNFSEIRHMFDGNISIFDDCAQTCRDDYTCLSFTFNFSSSSCTMTQLLPGFGAITYEIEPGFGNVTHGVKTGCDVSTRSTPRRSPLVNGDTTLSDCGLSPIPLNYCPRVSTSESGGAINDTLMDQIVKELIANLSVKPDTTSSYVRKHTSAQDVRPSAAFFGSVGVIVLIVVISLPVLADSVTYYFKTKLHRCKKSNKKNKVNR